MVCTDYRICSNSDSHGIRNNKLYRVIVLLPINLKKKIRNQLLVVNLFCFFAFAFENN